ncbi:unnamed protein product [Arctogadus glacialis]
MQCLSGVAAPPGELVQVCFPGAQSSLLDSLNVQREDRQLCDLSIVVQGQVYRAHRCVLAAASPYFHDQVLLKNMCTVSIPAAMDPLAFEGVLSCAYTGRLRMARHDIVNYLTVGSVLQMWHIVDKCTELLKEGRAAPAPAAAAAGGGVSEGGAGSTPGEGGAEGSRAGGVSGGATERPATVSKEEQEAPPPSGPALSESQSPSSTNYFSPRHGSGLGGGGATGTGGGANSTPSYCTPSGGEEAFLIEEEEEEEVTYHQRKRLGGGGGRRRKGSACEQEVGVSDSFGVSSYQAGEERRGYSQSGSAPRKQWVVVKTEQDADDDLILVSGEEDEEDEEEEDEEVARARERDHFNISNVRSLSSELGRRAASHMDTQAGYCQSSEDFLRLESSLMEHSLAQHLHEAGGLSGGPSGGPSRTGLSSSLLLGPQPGGGGGGGGAARGQLFPLDMQGNPILLYSPAPGSASLDPGGRDAAGSYKGHAHPLEHGAVHLGGLPPDAMDLGAGAGGMGGGGGGGGKLFMCHCGKTFTHRSMRDRHVNMHLDLRPFHCPVCAKRFKMKHHLTEHMKTHTGLKPYRCGGCARKFMWRDSYMRHRAQCERGGGGGGGEEPVPSPHYLLPHPPLSSSSSEEGGGLGGRGNHSNAGMGGPGAGPLGVVGGAGAGREQCGDEDPCEARANDGSVT